MTSEPPISVILPTRDRPALLDECLAGLRANNYPHREIIVVDQSAGGESAAVAQRAAAEDTSLRYVHSQQTGSSHAHNVALELAQGEIVAITNDDCRVSPNWLARLAEEFEADPQVVAVFGPFVPRRRSDRAAAVAALTGSRRHVYGGPQEVWRLGYGGNMAFRRQAVVEAGGLDERMGPGTSLGWGCNDIDLIYRVLRKGGTAIYAPDIVVWHAQDFEPGAAIRREARYARGAGALIAKALRCGDRGAWRLLAQRLWPVGPGRTWSELIETLDGGSRWIAAARALFRVYALLVLLPWGALGSLSQPIADSRQMLYQSRLIGKTYPAGNGAAVDG